MARGPARTWPAVVAVLVAGVGACGADPVGPEATGAAPAGVDVALTGTDDLKFRPSEVASDAGTVTVALTCGSAVGHDVVVEATDVVVAACEPGATATGTTTLDAGEYRLYCSVPGHREAGMEAVLSVS